MTKIADLLKGGDTVSFELDGKTHKIPMQPPTAAVARELRAEFYKLGNRANKAGDNATAELAAEFESCIGKVVLACIPQDSEESKMDEDECRLFVLRIGGDNSDVVKYAMRVCGIRKGDDVGDSDDADDAPF